MRFGLDPDQRELARTARAFLSRECPPSRVREVMVSERGVDAALWARIATELGWSALPIPEAYGGLGLGILELSVLAEELGRSLACVPFFSTLALGANALLVAGNEEQRARLLPGIADGSRTATLAWQGASGKAGAGGVEVVATPTADGLLLDGAASYVIDGATADWLVVAAREAGSSGPNAISLAVVAGDAPGLARRSLPTLDRTRRLAELRFDGVLVPARDVLGEPGASGAALATILDRAAAVLAAEQVGGAARCLELSVDYAKTRVQFGRPIGSFQAIKHKCADMMLLVESARSASLYASWAAATDAPDLGEAASIAKAYASDAYFACASETIQVHGGIGFTWEHDAHLYFKRAKASEATLGDPSWHRERIAARL